MNQPTLFDAYREPLVPVSDPNAVGKDRPRLAGQNLAILERLRQGPATNAELAELSLKYTSRCSDLRKAGYTIVCERRSGGVCVYRLED